MTDNEIKKMLECCKQEIDDNGVICGECKKCPNYEGKTGLCKEDLPTVVLDLINCLQARVEKCEKVEHFADKTITTLQAENERLKAENKLLIDNDVSNKYPNCVLVEKGRIYTRTLEDYDELIGDISAEARKEFAEKVKEIDLYQFIEEYYQNAELRYEVRRDWFDEHIDNLLKEKVGEDK